jgi:hypothetical protein
LRPTPTGPRPPCSRRAVVDDAIGVLVLDERGKLKTHNVGATSGGKGAAAGAVLGLLGPIGFGVGAAGGALLGKLHHKDLGLDDADRERLGAALRGGRAAVGLLADPDELVAVESIRRPGRRNGGTRAQRGGRARGRRERGRLTASGRRIQSPRSPSIRS